MSRMPKGLLRPSAWKSQTAPVIDDDLRADRGNAGHVIEGAADAEVISPKTPVPKAEATNLVSLDVAVRDTRARAGLQIQAEEEHLRERTLDVLRSVNVPLDESSFDLLISHIRRANGKYLEAFEALLDTGRTLNAIQKTIGPGGYKALVAAGVVQIGETNASKLRQIAAAVDSGKIPPPLVPSMPRNLSGAYVIAILPAHVIEPTMRALIDQGMLPESNYRRLESAIRSLREQSGKTADLHRTLRRKRTAWGRLEEEIKQLEAEIKRIEGEGVSGQSAAEQP
jgi:hypothetical protein